MTKRVREWDEYLRERLQDPAEMAAYLEAHLADTAAQTYDESRPSDYLALAFAVKQCIAALKVKAGKMSNKLEIKPGAYRTRDNRKAIVAGVKSDAEEWCPVIGWIDARSYAWSLDGKLSDIGETPADLVAPWEEPAKSGFHFEVQWSQEDGCYIGMCDAYVSLSHCADTPEEALRGIRNLVAEAEEAEEPRRPSFAEALEAVLAKHPGIGIMALLHNATVRVGWVSEDDQLIAALLKYAEEPR